MIDITEGPVERELRRKALVAAPYEVAGLITNTGVIIDLPNHAEEPTKNFEIRKGDILSALRMNEIEDLADLTLWHSHPNGGVGPSRIDMQQKVPFLNHLVVTIQGGDVVYTWY